MPRYVHLLEQPLDLGTLQGTMRAMQVVGVEYTQAEVDGALDAAFTQAKTIGAMVVVEGGPAGVEERKVAALIAYLLRLGTDLDKPTAPAIPAATVATTAVVGGAS